MVCLNHRFIFLITYYMLLLCEIYLKWICEGRSYEGKEEKGDNKDQSGT